MNLDDCVYAFADSLDETVDVDKSLTDLKATVSATEFTVDQVVEQFTKDYACAPDVYVKNIQTDAKFLIDNGFDSL